jgi:ribulose 1,5-bisphosphate synthetase/thiazole synthase
MRLPITVSLSGLAASAAIDQNTYDYVIVGGGTTGLVVANRLSENQNSKPPLVTASFHDHLY